MGKLLESRTTVNIDQIVSFRQFSIVTKHIFTEALISSPVIEELLLFYFG
jgi:hypothetical protein